MTPDQHREQAEEIRKSAPELDWLAKEHERAASMIEHPAWHAPAATEAQDERRITAQSQPVPDDA